MMIVGIAILYVLQCTDFYIEVFKYKKPIPKVLETIPKFEILYIVVILNS